MSEKSNDSPDGVPFASSSGVNGRDFNQTGPSQLNALAHQVCYHCKLRKRKCSKELPSCALCTRLFLKCQYSYDTLPTEAPPDANVFTPSTAGTYSLCSLKAASNILAELMHPSTTPEASSDIPVSDISDQVIKSLSTQSIPSIVAEYFQTIHMWLPIVSQPEFEKRLETLNYNPYIACLLLCMHLITQVPGDSYGQSMQTPTYIEAKTLHTLQISSGKPSLEIAHAGLLIALYEQGHGLLDSAQITIRSTSKIGAKLISIEQNLHTKNIQNTEVGRLWWGIVIVDRYMNLGASPEDIHFSAVFSNNYSQNLELPRDKKDLVQITIPKKLTPSGVPITNPTTELGPFCRAAEAAGLLGQVLELVSLSSGSDPISEQQSRSLDHSLQELAMSLLQQATNGWDECCAAIGICFSAIFSLHTRIWQLGLGDSRLKIQNETASMAIRSATRIAIDICRRFQMDRAYINFPALPLPSIYCLYQATVLHIRFAGGEFMESQWINENECLRNTLILFTERWNIGKYYIQQVDMAIAESRRIRAVRIDTTD